LLLVIALWIIFFVFSHRLKPLNHPNASIIEAEFYGFPLYYHVTFDKLNLPPMTVIFSLAFNLIFWFVVEKPP